MRGRIILGGLALAAALTAGGEASACALVPVTYIGGQPSARQLAAERARFARQQVRQRLPRAQAALAAGIDAPAELARMLVPNIRPVPIQSSDCGPENEIDMADGEEKVEDWLAGTYLVRYSSEFSNMAWSYRGETLGPACNAEFRERFAAHLRGTLDARQLRESYLFLAPRWPGLAQPVSRLVAFEDRRRRPPVRWESYFGPEIERWTRRTGDGRALQRAVDDFWRDNAALLETPDRACPAAVARWPAAQARIVAEIEARQPQFTAALRRQVRRP
jgi:hypothetical protein